jgi:hypothetical protein
MTSLEPQQLAAYASVSFVDAQLGLVLDAIRPLRSG